MQLPRIQHLLQVRQLQAHDVREIVPRQRVEDDHVIHPVEELGPEMLPQFATHRLLDRAPRRIARLRAGFHDVLAADVGGHDDHRVAEIHGAALAVGEPAVVQDLEQEVEDVRVRLLDLVEQHHAVGAAAHRLGELAPLFVADVARRRTNHPCHRVLLHVLRHVEPHHRALVVEQEFRERTRSLGFPHTGRPEENEGTRWTVDVLQAGPAPPHGVGDRGHRGLLACNALAQLGFKTGEPLPLRFEHLGHRNARPLGHDLGDVLGVHLLLEVARAGLHFGEPSLVGHQLLLQLGNAAVPELGRLLQVAPTRGELDFAAQRLDLCLVLANLLDGVLLRLPLRLHPGTLFPEPGDFLLHPRKGLPAGLVLLARERLALDFQLSDATLDLIDLLRQAVDLDAEAAGGLVHQVDRLVGQEPVADVAVGKRCSRHDGVVSNPHAVMNLVLLLEATEDRNRVGDAWLTHQHWLETTLQRGVLLDVLAILVQGRGADHVQLTPRQRGFQQVGGIHCPLGGAGAHDGVQLVDEDDVAAFRLDQLLDDRLEALLELAAVLGAGQQLANVEGHEIAVAKRLGHVAVHDPLGQALDDGGLAHAGLTDEDGVVLGATREHLHHTADFLIPANDRIELSAPGELGEVAGKSLERLVLLLRRLIGNAVGAAHRLQRLPEIIGADAGIRQQLARSGSLLFGERQEQVLGRDVGVIQLPGFLLSTIKNPVEFPAEGGLSVAALAGKAGKLTRHTLGKGRDIESRLLQQRLDDALRLGEQGGKEVGIVGDRVAALASDGCGVPEGLLPLDCESFWANHRCSVYWMVPLRRRGSSGVRRLRGQAAYPKPLPDWQK